MHVDFLFDFASPNAYLADQLVPAIEERTGAEFRYQPVLLGGLFKATGNQAPFVTFANVPAKLAYERLELARFVKRHALDRFKLNPHFPVNTLQVMRGAIAADGMGAFDAYYEAVMRAMWEDGRKMDDAEVIRATLDEAGLDGAAILAGTQTDEVKQRLIGNTEAAAKRGAFGIPTFFVGEEMFFGKDRLRDVEEEIARQQAG